MNYLLRPLAIWCLAVVYLSVVPHTARAETTLISDPFTTAGALNGRVPAVTLGGAAWTALTGTGAPTAAGGTLAMKQINQTDSIDLGANYIATHPGVYTMSLDVTMPAGTSGEYVGIGFVVNPVATSPLSYSLSSPGRNPNGGTNGGTPWMLLQQAGGARVYSHDSTYIYYSNNSYPAGFPSGTTHHLKLVLDTSLPQWVLTAYIDAVALDMNSANSSISYTFATNPTAIRYVAISAATGPDTATLDNFTLTYEPRVTPPVLPSDTLVDSVGVGLHTWSGRYGPISTPQILSKLTGAGIRHARDWLAIDKPIGTSAWQQIGAAGVGMDFVITPNWGTIPQRLAYLKNNNLVPYTEFIEDPNEPNSGTNWAPATVTFCTDLATAFGNDPVTTNIPILAPALAQNATVAADHVTLGDISSLVDFGNTHPYPGGAMPTANLVNEMPREAANVANKPQIVTETGYHNAVTTTSGFNPASETATSLYLPRLFFEYLQMGVKRTYWFDLLDNYSDADVAAGITHDYEAHFGLIRSADNYAEKPAYAALKNLITIMKDPGTTFTPAAPSYSITGSSDLKSSLFQKRDGTYRLAIWRNVSVYNSSRVDVVPPNVTVTVAFTSPKTVKTYFPTTAATVANTYTNVYSVQIPLSGQVAILQF